MEEAAAEAPHLALMGGGRKRRGSGNTRRKERQSPFSLSRSRVSSSSFCREIARGGKDHRGTMNWGHPRSGRGGGGGERKHFSLLPRNRVASAAVLPISKQSRVESRRRGKPQIPINVQGGGATTIFPYILPRRKKSRFFFFVLGGWWAFLSRKNRAWGGTLPPPSPLGALSPFSRPPAWEEGKRKKVYGKYLAAVVIALYHGK